MRLKFYAREGLVRDPEAPPMFGVPARYLGREFVPAKREVVDGVARIAPASNPATEAGFECDSESLVGERALKETRKGHLWPANKSTAEFCGVQLADLEFSGGVWDVKQPKSAGTKPAKAAE